jgi:hypothetical protein
VTTWDILLPTMPHRHDQMCALLAELDRQHQPGMGMIIYRDNLQREGNASYGKWQDLEEMSQADYTSFIGDDDFVAPDFVAQVMKALESGPDYVGFPVRYTYNGEQQAPVEHSLRHGGWYTAGALLCRDIVHHNPIRRELALLAEWRTTEQTADVAWASDLRNTGKVREEAWIDEPMYYYQETDASWTRYGSGGTRRPVPMAAQDIRPVPSYPWLTVRDEAL